MDTIYTLLPNGMVRHGDDTFIPVDEANRDWQEFLAWQAEGNEPEREPEPASAPLPGPSVEDLLKRIEALEAKLSKT